MGGILLEEPWVVLDAAPDANAPGVGDAGIEDPARRMCLVCGKNATKQLEISVGSTDAQNFQFYPLGTVKYPFCDDHAYPQVDTGLYAIQERE